MEQRPVIALLTDFGISDHYVGTMKGVMLGICSDAALVDLTHEIPAQDIVAGALELACSYSYFPAGTIFLAVVDPDVGSSRRALAVEAGAYQFVAPDNGILTEVLDQIPLRRAVELTGRRFMRRDVSRTFEGRDRFAPAAAWLATGVGLDELGPAIQALHRLEIPRPSVSAIGIDGQVVRVDRFGNLITNIDRRTLESMPGGEAGSIQIGTLRLPGIVATYAAAAPGDVCALFSSSGHLEIAVRGSSAALRLGAGRGAAVHIGWRA